MTVQIAKRQIAKRLKRFSALILLSSLASLSLAAEREALNDWSARIHFDYYAGDASALQRDLQSLKQLDVPDNEAILRQYYLAYGHMRLAETVGNKDRGMARKAASGCVDLADDVLDNEPKRVTARERGRLDTLFAELWAIRAFCNSLDVEFSKLPEPNLSSGKSRRNAAELAPNNPRVRLLAAIRISKRAEDAREFADAKQRLIAVTQLFASEPADDPDLPDWGQADAWAWLGYSYLKLDDKVAARNALEQALVLAPDYVWARELQSQLNSR